MDEWKRILERAERVAKTAPQFNFEDGVREVINRVKEMPANRIITVAVYGSPNSGKSYLINRLIKEFEGLGIVASGGGAAGHNTEFEFIKRIESLPLVKRSLGCRRLQSIPKHEKEKKGVMIFHCGWKRFPTDLPADIDFHNDPDRLSEKILKRKINLNIGIYNPKLNEDKLTGEYDLIVCNEDSVEKPPPFDEC